MYVPQKHCKYCGKWYSPDSFGVALTTPQKVYRRLKCRWCYRETKQAHLNRCHQWIINYKVQRGCSKCGIVDPRVLDLHHPDKAEKEFTVAYFRRNVGFNRIKAEVRKCEVLCANCHRILHWDQRKRLVTEVT